VQKSIGDWIVGARHWMPGTGCQGLTIPEEECEQGIDELFLQYKPEGPIILWEELLWKEKGVALLGRGESGIPILPFGFLLFLCLTFYYF
jgi:hypothetical protein